MTRALSIARKICWWGFGLSNAALVASLIWPSAWLPFVALGFGGLFLAGLLVLLSKRLAKWRAVAIAWGVYIGLRLLSTALAAASWPPARDQLSGLALLLALYAMLTALAALTALAFWRDVSVAYVALGYGLGAFLMLQMVRAAGGVFNFLTASSAATLADGAVLIGPLTLSLSCMVTLGFLTFFPHLFWMALREFRSE